MVTEERITRVGSRSIAIVPISGSINIVRPFKYANIDV
jgi:hypothetical protein